MWTPRRVMLLAGGMVAFAVAFLAYNRILGWMDGLPALPAKFLPSPNSKFEYDLPSDNRFDRLLRLAFGEDCKEVTYTLKLSMQSQGLLLASETVEIQPDGRLKVTPLSIAMFGKENSETRFREINTIHCDVAYITFDRKVECLSDMTRSKVVAAEFIGDEHLPTSDQRKGYIHVVHNHATPQADDDAVFRTRGPVFFRDHGGKVTDLPHLWCRSFVDITDYQSKPNHRIESHGMNIYLTEDALQSADRSAAKLNAKKPSVKAIELITNVDMKLWLKNDAAFPGAANPSAKVVELPPEDRPLLTIHTPGAFRYDVLTDQAHFDIPAQTSGTLPQTVEVIRTSRRTGNDMIQCDHMDIQFRRNTAGVARPAGPSNPAEAAGGLEIESMRAHGRLVVLTSDQEKLNARGGELVYNQALHQSILRGMPMVAIKDGNKIQAMELILVQDDPKATPVAADQPKLRAHAKGPGTIWLFDHENQHNLEVRWNRDLLVEREHDLDRLTLTGGAVFEDRERGQRLQGDQIKVWLTGDAGVPGTIAVPAVGPPSAGDKSKSQPQRLHVVGHVQATTPELRIDNTDLFVVWFQDVPTLPGLGDKAVQNSGPVVMPAVGTKPAAPAVKTAAVPAVAAAPASPAPKPLQVSARSVEAFILRAGPRNELDKVKCYERVVIHQDSQTANERGLDIRAQILDLTHTPDGDIVTLTGSAAAWAWVQSQQMSVAGPQLTFDQKENRAGVIGPGSMRMLAGTALNGEKRAQPVPVQVTWTDKMTFLGTVVSFYGGVKAQQDGVQIQCPKMDVYLDRVVSMSQMHKERMASAQRVVKPGVPGEANDEPKVTKVFCHRDEDRGAQPVTITEQLMKDGVLIRQQKIVAPEVCLYNDEGRIRITGPGEVRLLQWGEQAPIDPFAKPVSNSTLPVRPELKLTRVRFQGWMEGNNKLQSATFFTNVRAVHLPAKSIDTVIDDNKLLPGAFNMRCDRLLLTANEKNGKTNPSMVAEGRADVQSLEFSGRADTIKYDEGEEKKQQVIFDSAGGTSPAALYHIDGPGRPPRELLGKQIFYWRQTNEFKVIGAISLNGQ